MFLKPTGAYSLLRLLHKSATHNLALHKSFVNVLRLRRMRMLSFVE